MATQKNKGLMFIMLFLLCFFMVSKTSFAMDRRLKVGIKSSLLGAALGSAVGAGAWVAGLGNYKTVFMGASIGLYAGMLLGAYIVFWPEEKMKTYQKPLYRPRTPVRKDSWEYEDEETIPQEILDQGSFRPEVGTSDIKIAATAPNQKAIWLPILTAQF